METPLEQQNAQAPPPWGNGVSQLLEQAEQQLTQLLAGTGIDEARLERIVQEARVAREQIHDMGELERLLEELPVDATLSETDAVAALQQLLGAEAPPEVVPATAQVPPTRTVDLTRPELPDRAVQQAWSTPLEPHDTDPGVMRVLGSEAERAMETPASTDAPPPPSTREVTTLLEDSQVEVAPACSDDAAPSDPTPTDQPRDRAADFAAALVGQPDQHAQRAKEPAAVAEAGAGAGEKDVAFADSLFTAASAGSHTATASRGDSEFDLSETGEHEPVESPASATDVELVAVGGPAAPAGAVQAPGAPDWDDDEDVELLDDAYIEEVSELSSSHVLPPFSGDDATIESASRPPFEAEEMPTMPDMPPEPELSFEPGASPAADTNPPVEQDKPKKRHREKSKARSNIFRRLLGKDDKK